MLQAIGEGQQYEMSGKPNGQQEKAAAAPRRPRVGPSRDPMARVLGIEPRIPVAVMVGAAVLAVSLHAGAAVGAVQAAVLRAFGSWARDVRSLVAANLSQTYEVEIAKIEKAPEPPKEEPKEEPKPEPEAKPIVKEPPKEEPKPEQAAASDAQKVLMQEPAKDEPIDLTDTNTFLNGNAENGNGGTTQINGRATQATYNPGAVATGTPGGTGTVAAPPVPKVDRSRAARIRNLSNLERCPFPGEADAEQIDDAAVTIEVRVSVEGRAESVTVLQDPGHGFGREAKRCALREKYDPALNVDGAAVPGAYRVRFRFSR